MSQIGNIPQQYVEYDLHETELEYQRLLEENRRLRERAIGGQQFVQEHPGYSVPLPQRVAEYRQPQYIPSQFVPNSYRQTSERQHVAFYSPQQLDARVKGTYSRQPIPQQQQQPPGGRLIQKICPYLQQGQNSTALVSLSQRNKYLEGKIFMLRKELQKQQKKIVKIEHNMNHQTSCPDCYQQRYYALLRMTSPN